MLMEAGDQMPESVNYVAFMSMTELESYWEVMCCEDANSWLEAMVMEMESQQKARTFVEVPRLKGENILECRWVFAYKIAVDGKSPLYKAWLVAKGFGQRPGEDFNEMFAPYPTQTITAHLICCCSTQRCWNQSNGCQNSVPPWRFGRGNFMNPPECFPPTISGHVWKLKKSIYGLKQATCMWC